MIDALSQALCISGRMKSDCPTCGATVRERQLRFYLERTGLLLGREGLRILHFAPEARFSTFLASFRPELHVLACAQAPDRSYEELDLSALPYDKGAFDLVIANGQLEVCADPDRALQEINRVLKPDGLALLQTSFSHVLHHTQQDVGLDSDALRALRHGDARHLRLFGRDLVARMAQHLQAQVLGFHQLATPQEARQLGLDEHEPFFLFRKHDAWLTPAQPLPLTPTVVDREAPVDVSVLCLAYNHAAFIGQTLASFVSQQTRFRFEIVVGEDCSSDGTLAIVRDWAQRYPELIQVLTGPRNLGMHPNFIRTLQACRGRYIALCEGDDRWSDPHKLQKQFDHLERNSECALVFGNVQAHRDGQIVYDYAGGAKVDLPPALLQRSPPINTLTVMFRNVLQPLPPELLACGAGDMFLWTLLGQHGHAHYMPGILPSIYNLHAGGAHSLTGVANQLRLRLRTFYAAFHYHARQGDSELAEYFLQGVARDVAQIVQSTGHEAASQMLSCMPEEMAQACSGQITLHTQALRAILAAHGLIEETEHADAT